MNVTYATAFPSVESFQQICTNLDVPTNTTPYKLAGQNTSNHPYLTHILIAHPSNRKRASNGSIETAQVWSTYLRCDCLPVSNHCIFKPRQALHSNANKPTKRVTLTQPTGIRNCLCSRNDTSTKYCFQKHVTFPSPSQQ